MRDEDWYARDLSGERFDNVLFLDIDLTEALNQGGVFSECTFRGVRFNVSEHRDAAFINCTFVRCSFFDATFVGCKLTGSRFDGCDFGPVRIERGDWSFVALAGADLRQATFSGVRLREADLSGCASTTRSARVRHLRGLVARGERDRLRPAGQRPVDARPGGAELQGAKITIDQAVQLAERWASTSARTATDRALERRRWAVGPARGART